MDDDLSFLDTVKAEKAPTAEELISNYPDGNSELTELTTPPKLQNVSPKDQHGTPTHSHKQEWLDSGAGGQGTPTRSRSQFSQGFPQSMHRQHSGASSCNPASTPGGSVINSWQHHGWDSGIHSLQATNGVPSVTSARSEMPRHFRSNQSSYAQSHISATGSGFSLPSIASTTAPLQQQRDIDNQSTFSYAGSDMTSRSSSRYPPMVPSSFPSSIMTATSNPRLGQEEAQKVIPDLVKYLQDPDDSVFEAAAQLAQRLTKNQNTSAGLTSIISSTELISAMIALVGPKIEKLPVTQKAIAATIHAISNSRDGLMQLIKNNGIKGLIILLTSKQESTQSFAVTALHNILTFANQPEGKRLKRQYDIKQIVRQEGGNERLCCLLKSTNNKFLAICTDSLHILAHASAESKVRILQSRAPEDLVRIMAHSSYPKLLQTTAKLLRVLSTCKHNKPEIVRLGGMQALGRHLASRTRENFKLIQTVLWTLRNLSDAATKMENMEAILHLLVDCLGEKDEGLVQCAAGTLMNLTCNNMKNKITVFQYKGIDTLCKVAMNTGNPSIVEPVLCCLRNITSRHHEAYNAALAIRNHHGLAKLVELLSIPQDGSDIPWQLIKPVLGIVRNMAQNASECQPALRGVGTIPRLVNLISYSKCYMNAPAAEITPQKWSRNPQNRIRAEDICIAGCDALNWLAKDDHNRCALISLRAIPTLCELIRHKVPMGQADLTPQQKLWNRTVKQESSLAENVCGAAAHVLLSIRVDDQARQILQQYRVGDTLDQFQRWLDSTGNSDAARQEKAKREARQYQQQKQEAAQGAQGRVPPMHQNQPAQQAQRPTPQASQPIPSQQPPPSSQYGSQAQYQRGQPQYHHQSQQQQQQPQQQPSGHYGHPPQQPGYYGGQPPRGPPGHGPPQHRPQTMQQQNSQGYNQPPGGGYRGQHPPQHPQYPPQNGAPQRHPGHSGPPNHPGNGQQQHPGYGGQYGGSGFY